MDDFKAKVERVIRAGFPDADIVLEDVPMSEKISGYIVWNGFAEVQAYDRQRHLRSVLRQGLEQSEELKLSVLLTFAPAELHAIREAA